VSELVAAGHSRIDATMLVIERITVEARDATTVVLVEGLSDRIAVEVIAERQGRTLQADGTSVVPTGGATNFTRLLRVFGPQGRDVRLLGLYDAPVEERVRRSLERAGVALGDRPTLESLGFHRCFDDLEQEMIRALGPQRVEEIVAAEGELRSLRRLQAMPFHQQRSLEDQLHRFIASRSGRKYRYARALAASLDLAGLPEPLAGLLADL
jgi:hypothetical protein